MLVKKTVTMLKIKTLKHYENLLKVGSEIKQYVCYVMICGIYLPSVVYNFLMIVQ